MWQNAWPKRRKLLRININHCAVRYFIELAYDGTAYHGWQIQPNASSVQGVINDALAKLFRPDAAYIVGCGRTDTGVHADYFVAHFDLDHPIDDLDRALFKLNSILPPDIAVYSLQLVDDELHSRFSATERTYFYRLATNKSPQMRWRTYHPYFQPDYELMNRAAELLIGEQDFTSFSRLHTQTNNNICDVRIARWERYDAQNWQFRITANRFLRNMVRAVVGTLFDVGRGKMTIEQFANIISARDRALASTSAPPQGLSLVDVIYPEGHGFIAKSRIL